MIAGLEVLQSAVEVGTKSPQNVRVGVHMGSDTNRLGVRCIGGRSHWGQTRGPNAREFPF